METHLYKKYRVVFNYCHTYDLRPNEDYVDDKIFNSIEEARDLKLKIDKAVEAYKNGEFDSPDFIWGKAFVCENRPIGEYILAEKNHIEMVVARTHILDDDYIEGETLLDTPTQWTGWLNKRTELTDAQQELIRFALSEIKNR